MNNIKLSVIIPVYNAEKYLRETLDSLLSQTMKDFEVLLIDDGSQDSSPAICDEYAARDARFRAIHKPNGGVSKARNLGMDKACGEWITFVDADDLVPETAFEAMMAQASDDVDNVIGSIEKFGDETRVHNFPTRKTKDIWDEIFMPAVWAQIFRKSILKEHGLAFREDLAYSEDTVFVYTYRQYIRQLVTLEDIVYRYRINADSVTFSSNLLRRATHHMKAANCFQQLIDSNTDPKAIALLTQVRNGMLQFVKDEVEQMLPKEAAEN